jgi:hypothetical protein
MLFPCTHSMPLRKKRCSEAAALWGEWRSDLPLPLLELPEPILSLVAKEALVPGRNGHPMLAVSRSARDAVLRTLSQISLDLKEPQAESEYRPLGRLLQRAGTEAAPGLSVVLNLCHGGLPFLLQPALNTTDGLRNVHTLEVRSFTGSFRAFAPAAIVGLSESGITVGLQHHWWIDMHYLSTSVAGFHATEQLSQPPGCCHAVLKVPVHGPGARIRPSR